MFHTRSIAVSLLLALSLLITGCGGNVFVPLPPAQPTASTPAQTPGAGELLGAIATAAATDEPDLAVLASAPDAGARFRPIPDLDRTAQMLNSAPSGAQLLSDSQRAKGNKLYETLRAGSDAIFVLQTARCTFDAAQGVVLYEGSNMKIKTQDVQADIRGQLQEMYFRVQGGGVSVDVTPGGGPAEVQLRSDGTVALGWQGQTGIGSKQIIGVVGDDRMAFDFQSDLTTVIYGSKGGRSVSGTLLCPMSWLAQADWPPLPPYNVQIQSTAQRCLAVSWQANTAKGVQPAKYIVFRYLSDDSAWREVATVSTNAYQDCSQEAIDEWSCAYYYVVAVSRNGHRSSPSDANNIQLIDRMLPW